MIIVGNHMSGRKSGDYRWWSIVYGLQWQLRDFFGQVDKLEMFGQKVSNLPMLEINNYAAWISYHANTFKFEIPVMITSSKLLEVPKRQDTIFDHIFLLSCATILSCKLLGVSILYKEPIVKIFRYKIVIKINIKKTV